MPPRVPVLATAIRRRVVVADDVTPIFSLGENAIAKEPGSSYFKPWRCVSRLGASVVV
jgi:hypothetical protein